MSAVAVQSPVVANGHAESHTETNGDISMNGTSHEASIRFTTGLILPPPEIKCECRPKASSAQSSVQVRLTLLSPAVIDRTALFVARSANPIQFEDKIREGQRSDPKFSFLNPVDPYHAYYRHRMTKIAEGESEEIAPEGKVQEVTEIPIEILKGGIVALEPPAPEFILDLPHISPVDL